MVLTEKTTEIRDPLPSGLTHWDLLEMYNKMVMARALYERMWLLNRSGKAPFIVTGEGHEGAQVGSAYAVRRGHDFMLPYYRDMGVVLTIGMTPQEIMLNALSRAADPNGGGRQMPSHWSHPDLRIVSHSSPVATHILHAVGIAHAARIKREDTVAVAYFGEGATSKGDFHEGLNWAAIFKLPVIFICENNGYAISVPASRQTPVQRVAERALAYGFPGVTVDGSDVVEVFEATQEAVSRARRGEGPTLIEAVTYRFGPHTSNDDDSAYRSKEEVDAARKRDPIPRLRSYLLRVGALTEEEDQAIRKRVRQEIDEAEAFAEASPLPRPEDALLNVYAELPLAGHRKPTLGDARDGVGGKYVAKTLIEAVQDGLREEMAHDSSVVVLGEDVGVMGGVFRATEDLIEEFGEERVIDTPLAESAIVGVAIGMSLNGLRPVAEIQFADFIHSALDQLISEAAKLRYRSNGGWHSPIVVRVPYGAGIHGGLYHSQSIEALLCHIPGLKVLAPSTPYDAKGLLRAAIRDEDPVIFLEHKKLYRLVKGEVPDEDYALPIGQAEVRRMGSDITVVTYGIMLHYALGAAERLSHEGIEAEVIDLRTLAPLDEDTVLASVRKTGKVLVAYEDNQTLGLGAEVAARIAQKAFDYLDAPVARLAAPDVPSMPFAQPMEGYCLPDEARVEAAMRELAEY